MQSPDPNYVHLPPEPTPSNEDTPTAVKPSSLILPPGLPSVTPSVPVLVVDDDSLTRTLMKRMLTRMGCSVSTAENGEIAVNILLGSPDSEKAANAQEFAVVFMDNQMPVMSGLQAITKLRQVGRKDFVVGVTGNALLADQQVSTNGSYPAFQVAHFFDRSILMQEWISEW